MITFRTRIELHRQRHIGIYVAYGVYVYRRHRLITHIPDVFCHLRQAKAFINLCNREQPEPVHLTELIEDVI